MQLSNNLLQHIAASNETVIVTNEEGEPAHVVVPYQKYLQLLNGAAVKNSAKETAALNRKRRVLTNDQLLDTINREIAQRKDEHQLPLMPGDDSVITDADDSDDAEDQLYLEDITS